MMISWRIMGTCVVWNISVMVRVTATPLHSNTSTMISWYEIMFAGGRSTIERRENLEKQFIDHFGDDNINKKEGEHSTFWRVLLLLDRHDTELVRQICREADVASLAPSSTVGSADILWPYDLYYGHLVMGNDSSKMMRVVILECIVPATGGSFYLTKGRRDNAVYFVKPAMKREDAQIPDEFIFDENFESDADLKTDFKKLANAVKEASDSRYYELRVKTHKRHEL